MGTTNYSNPRLAMSMSATGSTGTTPAPLSSQAQSAFDRTFVAGNGAGNVNKVYCAAFSVVAGTPLTLDLFTASALLDICNNPIGGNGFLQGFMVETDDGNAGTVTLGGGANPVIPTDGIPIQAAAGVCRALADTGTTPADGLAIATGTKAFTLTSSAGTQTGQVTLFIKQ